MDCTPFVQFSATNPYQNIQPVIYGFCFFTNLPLPQNFLERREVATKERKIKKSGLYCIQTSSFLFVGMWRVCKSSKIKHPGGSGGSVLEIKGRPRPLPTFQDLFTIERYLSEVLSNVIFTENQ